MRQTLPMIALTLMLACAANDGSTTDADVTKALDPDVFGHWVHSREEDAEEIHVYRAAGFDFPAARYREAFEIRRDGTFVFHEIGRGDAPERMVGMWTQTGPTTISVSFADRRAAPMTIIIIAAEPGILRIRPVRMARE